MKASDLIQAMTDAGAPMAAVLIALREIESRDEAIERQRSAARDRKRRQRAKSEEDSGTVTGQSRDIDVTVTADPSLSPSPLSSPQTPQLTPRPHTHPDITPARVREADPFPMPDWCPSKQVWLDLKANRKAKRLPCTATAHAKLLRDIEKYVDDDWPPGRVLSEVVARGWAAVYDPKDDRTVKNERFNQQRKPTTLQTGWMVAAEFEADESERGGSNPDLLLSFSPSSGYDGG